MTCRKGHGSTDKRVLLYRNLASVSGLGDLSGCSSLTTIYADSTWTLPSSGISGSQCFYNCRALVGGNGTTWSSSNVGYAYMRIDTASTPGYMTSL